MSVVGLLLALLSFKVTDENVGQFEKIFDFTEVRKIRDSESDEYDTEDLFWAATDSGGYSCGGCNWVKKDAKRSKSKLITKTNDEIASLERQLKWKKESLEQLLKD